MPKMNSAFITKLNMVMALALASNLRWPHPATSKVTTTLRQHILMCILLFF